MCEGSVEVTTKMRRLDERKGTVRLVKMRRPENDKGHAGG